MATIILLKTLIGIAVFIAVYSFFSWLSELRKLHSMSRVDMSVLQIEEALAREHKTKRGNLLKFKLKELGYEGDLVPVILALGFAYLAVASVLSLFFSKGVLSLIIAVPACFALTISISGSLARRRQEKTIRQVLQVLRNVILYLESGKTLDDAIRKAATIVDNPLRFDIIQACNSVTARTAGLGAAMKPLTEKYPSTATRLLVAALEVNDKHGARLLPTLKQAMNLASRQIELAAEATAEISQARGEFIGITIVMGFIALGLMASSGVSTYTSPGAAVVLGLGAANYGLGFWRTMRVFRKAKGGVL
jgi:Flp pilus assembly protein TadB